MGNMAPLFHLSYPKGTDYALNERGFSRTGMRLFGQIRLFWRLRGLRCAYLLFPPSFPVTWRDITASESAHWLKADFFAK